MENKYVQLKELGSGSFGDAILVRRKRDNRLLVAKRLRSAATTKCTMEDAMQEARLLRQLRHSNIVGYVESFVDNRVLWIIMDYADGGDLHSLITERKEQNKYWSETEVIRIFIQLCLALKFIHDKKILHRDLKAQNVFLTKKGVVKLGDFGIARVLDNSIDVARTQIGTPYYLSPEICRDEPYGKETDIWSLGCVLYEMLALQVPFQGNTFPAIAKKIMSSDPDPIPSQYSTAMQQLVSHLLTKSANGRPSINKILKRPFIQEHIRKLISHIPSSNLQPPPSPSGSLSPCNSPAVSVSSEAPTILDVSQDDDDDEHDNVDRDDADEDRRKRVEKLHQSFVRAGETACVRRIALSNAMAAAGTAKFQDEARRMFLENQAARQKNRERVEEQARQPACFLQYDDEKPSADARVTPTASPRNPLYDEEQLVLETEAPMAVVDRGDLARQQYDENRQAAKRIKAKVYQQLGRYMPGEEPSPNPLFSEYPEQPPPPPRAAANATMSPTTYADIARQNYEENRKAARVYRQRVDVQLGRCHEESPPQEPRGRLDDDDRKDTEPTCEKLDEQENIRRHNQLARELRHERRAYAEKAKVATVEDQMSLAPPPPPQSLSAATAALPASTEQQQSFEELLAMERKRVYEDRKALWKRVRATAHEEPLQQVDVGSK